MQLYELLRRGRTEDISSQFGRLILGLLDAAGDLSQIEFGKLAPFADVRQYFGTSGLVGRQHPTGWLLEGIIEPPGRQKP